MSNTGPIPRYGIELPPRVLSSSVFRDKRVRWPLLDHLCTARIQYFGTTPKNPMVLLVGLVIPIRYSGKTRLQTET